ncbi:MAG: hypothetical protein V5A88_02265 [Candidatus Thermoplasmatota archaeon]
MAKKRLLMATIMVILLATGAVVTAALQAQGEEDTEVRSNKTLGFEIGTVDVETKPTKSIPPISVNATYSRVVSYGETPERYRFEWNTTVFMDGETKEFDSGEVTLEGCEGQCEYTINHPERKSPAFPDYPEGEYFTELRVYAEYEDGTEMIVASNWDSFYLLR